MGKWGARGDSGSWGCGPWLRSGWGALGLLWPLCGLQVYYEDSGTAGEGTARSLGSWPGLLRRTSPDGRPGKQKANAPVSSLPAFSVLPGVCTTTHPQGWGRLSGEGEGSDVQGAAALGSLLKGPVLSHKGDIPDPTRRRDREVPLGPAPTPGKLGGGVRPGPRAPLPRGLRPLPQHPARACWQPSTLTGKAASKFPPWRRPFQRGRASSGLRRILPGVAHKAGGVFKGPE